MSRLHSLLLPLAILGALLISCNSKNNSPAADSDPSASFEFWLTNGDRSALFQKQPSNLSIAGGENAPVIEIENSQSFQSIDGFGGALTGGSALVLSRMSAAARTAIINELFGTDGSSIGISYLRISIGSSDLDEKVFSYDDLPLGQVDTALALFDLGYDRMYLVPVLRQILTVNPTIRILGSPWSAPLWMKTNGNSVGGSLKAQYYPTYAKYFVKYVQEMKKAGIRIDAITVQNEPLYGGNNPSMVMQATEQADFVGNHLGPAFAANGIDTKIVIYDHNADRIDYPMTVLKDQVARRFVDGSAFHLYGGRIEDISALHDAHPDKNLYFTEQWVGAPGNLASDLAWHTKMLIIGATRNWCKNVLEWNLAADPNQDPHTSGGCSQCLGAITISGDLVARNPAYYILAHAAKFVRPGSVRIESTLPGLLYNVAFRTPDGKKVLIVLNDDATSRVFRIKDGAKEWLSYLKAGSVATYIW